MLAGFLLLGNVVGELGSVVFVPIAFMIFDFSIKETLALCNTTVFFSTVTRMLLSSIWNKHENRTVIDYSLTSIITPMVMVGTYFGALSGVMFPQLSLTVVLTVALLSILILTVYKGTVLYRKDSST